MFSGEINFFRWIWKWGMTSWLKEFSKISCSFVIVFRLYPVVCINNGIDDDLEYDQEEVGKIKVFGKTNLSHDGLNPSHFLWFKYIQKEPLHNWMNKMKVIKKELFVTVDGPNVGVRKIDFFWKFFYFFRNFKYRKLTKFI